MATSIHPSIPVLSPSFLYLPYNSLFGIDSFIMCLLAFFVTSADKSHVICIFMQYIARGYLLFTNTQCLCGVVDVVLHNYVNKRSWPLLTLGTYRYI